MVWFTEKGKLFPKKPKSYHVAFCFCCRKLHFFLVLLKGVTSCELSASRKINAFFSCSSSAILEITSHIVVTEENIMSLTLVMTHVIVHKKANDRKRNIRRCYFLSEKHFFFSLKILTCLLTKKSHYVLLTWFFFGLVGWHMGLVKDDMVWMDIYMMYMVFKCIALNEQWAF